MKRLTCMASVLVLLAASALVTDQAGAGNNTEAPSIKDVMGKLHKGANAPLNKLKKSSRRAPNWMEIQDSTKLFAELGPTLAQNDPPKGDKENFKKLATAYGENAKALDDSARKEKQAEAQAAFGKLSTSCMPCHKDHRPPPG